MQKPRKKLFNQRRETVTFFFQDYDDSAEFYVRGAVSWPEEGQGFGLLAGQEVESKIVHIFDQFSFFTIDNVKYMVSFMSDVTGKENVTGNGMCGQCKG